jgi:AcrR family transcriptional regulator
MDDVASSWDDTVTDHRDRRRQSIIDATMTLVAERGLSDVSMAEVAKAAGIGRATLYRYFPGVEEIVAERVLGLPHDVDVAKGLSWSEAQRVSGRAS